MNGDFKLYPFSYLLPKPQPMPRTAAPLLKQKSSSFIKRLPTPDICITPKSLEGRYINSGYSELLIFLSDKKGYYWDKIKTTINHPAVAEALFDLVVALEYKEKSHDKSCCILTYAFQLASQSDPIQHLGELLFLSEFYFERLVHILKQYEYPKSFIENLVSEAIQEHARQVINLESEHKRIPLQHSDEVIICAIPLCISRMLISSPGVFNRGLIPAVKKVFSGPFPFQKQLVQILDTFDGSPFMRNHMRSIKAPMVNTPSEQLVQTALGIFDEKVGSHEAQQAAFAALLTHMRQGTVASCFAYFLNIGLLQNQILKCLKDFKEMIETGQLTRRHKNRSIIYPLIVHYTPQTLDTPLLITTPHFDEAPGLIAACQAMGIVHHQKSIQHALNHMAKFHTNITPRELIEEIAKRDPLCSKKGLIAFESQVKSPLHTAWMTAIASMAEKNQKMLLSRHLFRCIIKPLTKKYRQDWPDREIELERYKSDLTRKLKKRARLIYDPEVKHRKTEKGESSYGAFVLYDMLNSTQFSDWKKIHTQNEFIEFVLSLFSNENTRNFINTQDYIEKVLLYYQASSHDSKQYHTPWLDESGNDPKTVLLNYWEKKNVPSENFTASNAEDLMIKLIHHFRDTKTLSSEAYLFINSSHACNLIVNTFNFKHAMESLLPPRGWIYGQIIQPAQAIVTKEMGQKQMEEFIEEIKDACILKKEKMKFVLACRKLLKSTAGIFAQELVKCLITDFYINPRVAEETVDTILFSKILTPHDRGLLLENALIIADSNWGFDKEDIYLGFLYNIRTNKVELWKIRSDKGMAVPLNQKEWVEDHCWEITR